MNGLKDIFTAAVVAGLMFTFLSIPIVKFFLKLSFEKKCKEKEKQNNSREEDRILYLVNLEKIKLKEIYQKKMSDCESTYQKKISAIEIEKKKNFEALKYRTEFEKEEIKKEKEDLNNFCQKFMEEKTIGFPWVAEIYSLYMTADAKKIENNLRNKKNPAIKSADAVKEFAKRAKDAERKYLITLGLLKYYEHIYPDLEEFQEAPDEILLTSNVTSEENIEDPAKKYLSINEWDSMTNTEKFQKSLDDYCKKKKNNWEIGREYERFIGYEYEKNGWHIKYYGATEGLCDLGRDLIAKKGSEILIIQCKYWAKGKIIHEKHLFQLYGTTILFMIENRLLIQPKSLFITSCQLSETAKKIANYLNITIVENKYLEEYPRIKCNVNKDGEKIYHLPFDQQYDRVRIKKDQGEFFCYTIREAEKAGFRRAYRWRGGA